MFYIPDYDVGEKIHEGRKTIIYKGIRLHDNISVLLLFFHSHYPNLHDIEIFKNEYEINQKINSNNVVKIYDIENYEKIPVLVLEDFGGYYLNTLLNKYKKFDLLDFLKISIDLAQALIDIHKNNITHSAINPANIIVNMENKTAKLSNFINSSYFEQQLNNLDLINDSNILLEYISPEQTGRISNKTDYRTDLYSLGITFYIMLTGILPFNERDKLSIIHYHLAVQPIPPNQINSEIPKVISDIVMKLMEKMPENRYQSAIGLKFDLKKCMHLLKKSNSIPYFELGKNDISATFKVSNTLYGREQEIKLLKSSLKKNNKSQKEIIMVTGSSGLGKSKLISSIINSNTTHYGHFVSGKFDQFEHNIPYSAIIYAFKDLIQQILNESKDTIEFWKNKLSSCLGSYGQIIINLIPDVELIIGKQPEIPSTSQDELKNIFFNTFKDFVGAFCEMANPLVIFLDDLQWADPSSLKLIEILVIDPKISNLLFIGSYRNNELSKIPHLNITLENIKKENIKFSTISLKPLNIINIHKLLVETFHYDSQELNLLAEICEQKTGGNPFFIFQFLQSLYSENLIYFNKNKWKWELNLNSIQDTPLTDNVLELISYRILKFPLNTIEILKLASCIGSQFDLNTLSIICKKSVEDIYNNLFKAIKNGIILPIANNYSSKNKTYDSIPINYAFLHDHIQQAVYSLIKPEEKKDFHLNIGLIMLSNYNLEEDNRKTLDVVNQLNLGIDLLNDSSKKHKIAQLELTAGKIAKKSNAYDIAYKYLKNGIKLIENLNWDIFYNLMYDLHLEISEAAYLNGDFEAVEYYTEIALNNINSTLDKVKLYEIRIISYAAQNQKLKVLNTAISVLNILNIRFPKNPKLIHVLISLMKIKLMLLKKNHDILLNSPQISNRYLSSALEIIAKMGMSTYMLNPNLFLLIILKAIQIYIENGNLDTSPIGYAAYGMLLCSIGDIDSGYKFGQLSYDLLKKFDNKEYKSQTLVLLNCFINPWKLPIRDTLDEFTDAYLLGLETGNINYTCTSACLYGIYAYYSGQNLIDLEKKISDYSLIMIKLKNKEALITNSIYHQAILNLINFSEDPSDLIGKVYDELKMIPAHLEIKDRGTLCNVYVNKLILSFIFCDYNKGLEFSYMAKKYLDGVSSTLTVPIFYFYSSLTMLSNLDDYKTLFKRKYILSKVYSNQKKMTKWAKHSESNFLNKYYLVEAEIAKVSNNFPEAIRLYEKAINLAAKNNFIQEEAISNELAAKFYMSIGNDNIGRFYITKAVYCYNLWGAKAKVMQLRNLYSSTLNYQNFNESIDSTFKEKIPTPNMVLDTETIIKATHAISSEIKLKELLKKLVHILLENAGAQKVYYLAKKEEKYIIQAEGNINTNTIEVMKEINFSDGKILPNKIIYYVATSGNSVILDDASNSEQYSTDPYIIETKPKSIMCLPILSKGNILGIIYLENNLINGVFNSERVEILKVMSSQLAISLENAILYTNLERSEKQLRKHHNQLEELVEKRTTKLKKEITQHKKTQKLLEKMANYDALTNLPNRKFFYSELNRSLKFAKENDFLLGILFIDLDGFKEINDTLGHNSGDTVLKVIANRLLNAVREIDIVSRFGGDEFVIIIKNLKDLDILKVICEKIISEVGKVIIIDKNEGQVTASIGVATFPNDTDDINKLISKADNAMYQAKNSGKNKVIFT